MPSSIVGAYVYELNGLDEKIAKKKSEIVEEQHNGAITEMADNKKQEELDAAKVHIASPKIEGNQTAQDVINSHIAKIQADLKGDNTTASGEPTEPGEPVPVKITGTDVFPHGQDNITADGFENGEER